MAARLRRLGPKYNVINLPPPEDGQTKVWLVGRGSGCQIYTKSKFASRKHFSITYKKDKYFICDLQSANGTYVNDEKVVSEKVLSCGNVISVGVPSQLQNEPDFVVYIFELNMVNSDDNVRDMDISNSEDEEILIIQEVSRKDQDQDGQLGQEAGSSKEVCIKNFKDKLNSQTIKQISDINCPLISPGKELSNETLKLDKRSTEKTLNSGTSKEAISMIEVICQDLKHDPNLAKKRKLNEKTVIKSSEEMGLDTENELESCETQATTSDPINVKNERTSKFTSDDEEEDDNEDDDEEEEEDNDDEMVYQVLTQVDEPTVKVEPELLNYSVTEELIEISDSEEEEWASGAVSLKNAKSKTFEEEEDDGVIFLERIIRPKSDLPQVICKVEDDLTETDKKWIEKLLKSNHEKDAPHELQKSEKTEQTAKEKGKELAGGDKINTGVKDSKTSDNIPVEQSGPSSVSSANVQRLESVISEGKITRNLEKTGTKMSSSKSVRFSTAVEIKYIEPPTKYRLTPADRGRLQFMKTIYSICNWNTHWLEECKRVAPEKDPPDLCDEPLRKISRKFTSHLDYMGAFIPALLLQLWNRVKEKWVASGDASFRMTVSCDSCEDDYSENLCLCKCSGIVQSVKGHQGLLREGHLVLLRLHQVSQPEYKTPAAEKYFKKLGYLVFGFVESKVYEPFKGQPMHPALAERCSSIQGDLHVVKLNILVKKRPNFEIDKQKLIQLTAVEHISSEIRMLRGICFLADSPLCKFILKPTRAEGPLITPPAEEIIFKDPLDSYQKEIVSKLCHACSSTDRLLYSIHGAAGTGKGQVVMAFMLQLLHGKEWKRERRPKLLYCTRSGVPLDEMVCRLKNYQKSSGEEKRFKVIRVGQVSEAKPEVRDVCLATLALAQMARSKRPKDERMSDVEARILDESDVICATCNSAGTTKMSYLFEKLTSGDEEQRVICIVDDAMSCKEAESVIPLLLGVTHLVLVGDAYQFEPPFSGEKTHYLGSDVSLFWRIYKNFNGVPKDVWPIFTLINQYRMNGSLSNHIGRLIYNSPLLIPEGTVSQRIPGLRSHLLLMDQSPEDVRGTEKKTRETRLVTQLVRAVLKIMRESASGENLSLAVITCAAGQNETLQSFLPKSKFPEVEVNDVQGFQGREVDVAVFHYDGTKIFVPQIAVAVTRARRSLFVLVTQDSIAANPWFQKFSEEAEKYKFLKYIRPNMALEELERIVSRQRSHSLD